LWCSYHRSVVYWLITRGLKKSALSRIRRSEWSIFTGHSRLVGGVGHCLSRSMFLTIRMFSWMVTDS
jgi:hypothetical protein